MLTKEILATIAIGLTLFAFLPYIHSILKGKTKPHLFSWVIWGATTFIVFLAQRADHAGVGAWPIGISGIITLCVAALAYIKKSDHSITKIDWVFLLLAIGSLPLWYFSANPLTAVVVLTTIDLLGFAPTFRKSWSYPFEEQLVFYLIMAGRNILVIFALENYSFTTVLFPLLTGVACLLLIIMVLFRRSGSVDAGRAE